MCNFFQEHENADFPCLILMSVTDKDSSKQQIVGGFSSHGFTVDPNEDESMTKDDLPHGGD